MNSSKFSRNLDRPFWDYKRKLQFFVLVLCACVKDGVYFSKFLQVTAHFSKFLQVTAHFSKFLQVTAHFSKFLQVTAHFSKFPQVTAHFSKFLQVTAHFLPWDLEFRCDDGPQNGLKLVTFLMELYHA